MVRSVAIKMAGECEVKSLQDALVAVALDATEPVFLRVDALYALRSIADQSSRPQLKPLLSLGASEDPDDQIKGCVLDLVWPHHIVLNELFASLSSPRRPELYGAYRAFLGRLKDDLKPEQLSTALEWIKSRTGQIDGLTDVDNAIIALGCKSIRLPGIVPLLAACLALRMNDHHVDWQNQHETSSIRSVMATDVEGRRLLLQSLAPLLSKFGQLELFTAGFVLTEDFAWVLDQIVQNSQVADKNLWCQIAGRLFDTTNSLHLDHIFAASQRDTTVASQFEWLLYPVPLDSPLADQMRKGYRDRMDLEVKRAEYANYKVEPPPEARIKNRLEQFEGGEMAAFWWLTQEMTLKPDSRIYESTSKSDVTGFPGWIDADCETRIRVLRAAKDYILYGDPENRAWLGTDTFNCTAVAGFRAMRLVYKREPAWLDACGAEVWQKWTAILLTYFTTSGQGVEDREALVKRAYENAPDEVLSVLQQMIDVECAKHSRPFIVRHVEHCWDKRLESALLDKVAEPNLSASCIAYLLDRLLAHESVAAEKYALSLLNPIPARSHSGWRRSVGAGAILTLYADGSIWDKIWRAMGPNVEFGREMVSQIGSYSELGEIGVGRGLSEQQLADFFIWLEREFPHSEDPSVGSDGWTTPRGSVAQLRSGVLYRLRRLGTPQSCTELRRIAQECPALDWMKGIIKEAETTTREKTWVPPIPSEVLALAQKQSARLVTDGSQLLEVLLESLQKIEDKIRGETREVHLLWDRLREGIYRPKDENILSDYLKNRLDDLHRRGVIVNREVEIHRPEQGKPGQRTDIHIDAVSPRTNGPEYDRITVILETKGCWHRDLQVAMKTQLVDRYLKDNRSKCGLYLVGWYSCDKWDTEHYQRKDAERWGWSLREAREYFAKQAAELSVDGLLIKAFVLNLALPQKF